MRTGRRLLSALLATVLLIGMIPAGIIPSLAANYDSSPRQEIVFTQKHVSNWDNSYQNTWYNKRYGPVGCSTYKDAGCGILSVVNSVHYLTGKYIDPLWLGDWATEKKYRKVGQAGTAHDFFESFAASKGSDYGFYFDGTIESNNQDSFWQIMRDNLSVGMVAIVHIPGHFMAIVDYEPTSNCFLLMDSNPVSFRKTNPNGLYWGTAEDLINNAYQGNSKNKVRYDKAWFYAPTRGTISAQNKYVTAKDVSVPKMIITGKPFEFIEGTVSATAGRLHSFGAAILDANGRAIQLKIKDTNKTIASASEAFDGLLDFSSLSPGKYTLRLIALSRMFALKIIIDDDSLLDIYTGEFTVGKSSSKAPSKVAAKANGNVKKDKYGNTYTLFSSYKTGSSNSYYDGSASYPIGTYRVKVNTSLNIRKKPTANSASLGKYYNGDIVEVTATNGNWGYTSRGWICLNYTVFVSGAESSYNSQITYNTGNYAVTASGLNVRKGPSTKYARKTSIPRDTEFKVTETDGAWGYSPDYDGWLCLNYARFVSDLVPELPVPMAPSISSSTASEIGVGEIITVSWNAVADADTYTAKLVDATSNAVVQTAENLTSTTASFTTTYAGRFKITVVASNAQHSSVEAEFGTIEAKGPSTVTFKDWDGKVLSTQTVAYGKDATAPATPTRTGYTFASWNGSLTAVREDRTITATYTKNSYTVTFVDHDGTTLKTQSVLFEDAAAAPNYTAPSGYSFVQWDKAFDNITEDTTVTAIVSWSSQYPLEISATSSVVRNNKTYVTTAIVNNSPNAVSNAKVIMALKTAEDKQLAYVESSNFSMAKGEKKTIDLSVNYDGASTVANIFVVQSNDEKVPLSNSLNVAVDQGTAWSAWSTSAPPAGALKSESRTEYRYRDKQFTTSTSSTLSGWTKRTDVNPNPTTSYGAWSNWSAWQDAAVSASDTREVKTQQAQDQAVYRTEYNYKTVYHYWRRTSNGEFGKGSSKTNGTYYEYTSDSALSYASSSETNGVPGYKYWYSSSNWILVWECDPLTTQEVASSYQVFDHWTYKTQYSYRTRSKTLTYHFWKWGNWSNWSTNVVTGTDNRGVETRTTYRYISNTPANIEDTSGTMRTISGSVSNAYSGKHAILSVVSADGTVQYIGQSKIASNGNYQFTFKLKEDPTIQSGDYSVRLSIEGTNTAMELDPILAPIPKYTVVFKDWDGTILDTQEVTKGENAIAPDAPEHTGYKFVKWNKSTTNITEDITITAVYAIQNFTVLFRDDLNDTTEYQVYSYGDELKAPTVATLEDYDFIGWSVSDGTAVTENLVVYARYATKTFDVEFLDYEGNTLSKQTVEYGDAAQVPVLENKDGYVFVAWNRPGDLEYVTQNMVVKPEYVYEESVAVPTANIETGTYSTSQTVTLSCETSGAEIYYTTDGSDPLELVESSTSSHAPSHAKKVPSQYKYNGTLYTGPFALNDSAELVFAARKDKMNSSDYSSEILAINSTDTTEKKHLVTIHSMEYSDSFLADDNETLQVNEEIFDMYGYTLQGVFADAEYTQPWNLETDVVTNSMELYLKWSQDSYTVKFLNKDGTEISSQTILSGESALPPIPEMVDGFIFTGWDSDYASIYEDTTVTATYISESDITSVSLDEEELVLKEGEESELIATVVLGKDTENDQVIWQSSNEEVATVDDNGTVKGIKKGTATIYAVSEDSGMSASCEVYVKEPDKPPYWGDFNNDGRVTLYDGFSLQRKVVMDEQSSLTDEQRCFCDLNLDGKITLNDCMKLLECMSGPEEINTQEKADISLTPPNKTVYLTGEQFNSTGLSILVANKENNSVRYTFTDNLNISGFDSTVEGIKDVIVTFRGLTFSFKVKIYGREAIDTVEALIDDIGEVKYSSESKNIIDRAREAYDSLSEDQKSFVSNYQKLVDAESKYNELKKGAESVSEPDPKPDTPSQNSNVCKYCGQVHSGPFGWLIKFFHSILALFGLRK